MDIRLGSKRSLIVGRTDWTRHNSPPVLSIQANEQTFVCPKLHTFCDTPHEPDHREREAIVLPQLELERAFFR